MASSGRSMVMVQAEDHLPKETIDFQNNEEVRDETFDINSTRFDVPINDCNSDFYKDEKDEQFNLYASVPPLEYIMHRSNIVKAKEVVNCQLDQSMFELSQQRLKALINDLDELLIGFKALINSTCSTKPRNAVWNQSETVQSIQNETSISLTETISLLLGLKVDMNTKLFIIDPERINCEYHRCSTVVNAVIEMISFKDSDEAIIDMKRVDEDFTDKLKYVDENQDLENGSDMVSIPRMNHGHKVKRKRKKVPNLRKNIYNESRNMNSLPLELREKLENRTLDFASNPENKMKSGIVNEYDVSVYPQMLHGAEVPDRYPSGKKRYRPAGYYPDFCINKNTYEEIIEKGKPFTCPCGKKFVHRRTFESHLNGQCIGLSAELKKLELHAKWKKEKGRFYCLQPNCTQVYNTCLILYQHHQKEHLKGVECQFKCDQCEKSFFMKCLLNKHVKRVHLKVTKICELCGKNVEATKLRLHMRRHTGEKPYKCKECEYCAVSTAAVNEHIRHVHESHKMPLHFCEICGKHCKTKGHLKEHILTHSDKRTLLCKICGKYLKNNNSYRRHMVSVHKVSHSCNVCGVDYFTLQGLQIHQLKVHNIPN